VSPFERACGAGLYALGSFLAYWAWIFTAMAYAVFIATLVIRSFYPESVW
jgi:hypothetical protein